MCCVYLVTECREFHKNCRHVCVECVRTASHMLLCKLNYTFSSHTFIHILLYVCPITAHWGWGWCQSRATSLTYTASCWEANATHECTALASNFLRNVRVFNYVCAHVFLFRNLQWQTYITDSDLAHTYVYARQRWLNLYLNTRCAVRSLIDKRYKVHRFNSGWNNYL